MTNKINNREQVSKKAADSKLNKRKRMKMRIKLIKCPNKD